MERRGPLVLGVRVRRSGAVRGGPSMNFDGRMGREGEEEEDGGVGGETVVVDCDDLDAIVYCGGGGGGGGYGVSSYFCIPKLVF